MPVISFKLPAICFQNALSEICPYNVLFSSAKRTISNLSLSSSRLGVVLAGFFEFFDFFLSFLSLSIAFFAARTKAADWELLELISGSNSLLLLIVLELEPELESTSIGFPDRVSIVGVSVEGITSSSN